LRNENKSSFTTSYLDIHQQKEPFLDSPSLEAAVRCKYLLENFDKELQVSIIKTLGSLKVDFGAPLIFFLLDMELTESTLLELAQKYRPYV
jgi:hypothetical protein